MNSNHPGSFRRAKSTLGVLLLCGVPALVWAGGSPIKSAKSLASKVKKAEKYIAKKHIKLAKLLKKKDFKWEAYLEAKYALRLDADNKSASKLLPKFPPLPSTKKNDDYKKAVAEFAKLAESKLGELLERGKKGEMSSEDLTPLAVRVLQYSPDHAVAREVLGFTGSAKKWSNARFDKLAGAYQAALTKAPQGKVVQKRFPKLEAALGLSLKYRESDKFIVAGATASDEILINTLKAAEVAYGAFHNDFFGVEGVFSSPDARPTTGVKLKPMGKSMFLLLDNNEQHERFLDKVVSDANMKVRGKKLAFLATGWQPEKIRIFESRANKAHSQEWAALMTTLLMVKARFGDNRPPYVVQGLGRYYSCHISQRAFLKVVAGGTMSDAEKDAFRRGDFMQLRWTARWAYDHWRAPLPCEFGLSKSIDAMNRGDVGVATAFIEFLMAKHPGRLLKFLQVADSRKQSLQKSYSQAFEKAKKEFDQEFLDWFVRNY